jgi:hypothetical protein
MTGGLPIRGGGGSSAGKTKGGGGSDLKNDVMTVHIIMYVDRWDSEVPQGGSGAGTGASRRARTPTPTRQARVMRDTRDPRASSAFG